MSNKSFGKNLFIVTFSRMLSLMSSVAVGFILPKIFTVTDYGFYKTFTLYAVYTSLLHLGFVDGILLKLSGMEYQKLNPARMRTYTRFFIFLESLISLIMLLIGFSFVNNEYLFIIAMLAINMVFVNITTYYQFISQAVQRFREFSAKNIAISVIKILFVLILFAIKTFNKTLISYKVYLLGMNILDFSILIWYVIMYRDITFGKRESAKSAKKDIISIFKTGIVLTLAYQVSHLILALDRQFVNLFFSTEVFAVYSFAYNIISMLSTMVSSVSVVLLPMLKNRSKEDVVKSYKKCLSTVSMISSAGLLCYFPLKLLIEWFLPKYEGSLQYISIVLPTFLFTSSITVVMFTIVKILDMNFTFFKDGCFILVLGILTNSLAYYLFKSPSAISYASLIVTMIWFLISEKRLKQKTGVGVYKDFLYLCISSIGFLTITYCLKNVYIGMILFLVWDVFWTIIFYRESIQVGVNNLKNKFTHN